MDSAERRHGVTARVFPGSSLGEEPLATDGHGALGEPDVHVNGRLHAARVVPDVRALPALARRPYAVGPPQVPSVLPLGLQLVPAQRR